MKTYLFILLCTALTVLTGTFLRAQEPEPNRIVTLDMKFHGAAPKGVEVHTPEASSGTATILYPEILAEEGVEGTVLLETLFAEDGSILRMETVENGADERLIASAVSGLKSMTFQPGTIAGRAAEMEVRVEVAFRLEWEEISFADVAEEDDEEEFDSEDYPQFLMDATPPTYSQGDFLANLEYPVSARQSSSAWIVYVTVYVDETGRVKDARVIKSSDTVFNAPTLAAVRSLTFQPAMRNGIPVRMSLTIPIRVTLRD